MTTETDNRAEEQAANQYSSIVRMLAALTCDYSRLEELREEREELTEAVNDAETDDYEAALETLTQWETENAEELAELEAASNGCEDEDAARDNIQEDPLEIQVRSDWASPGETLEASEFCILLCTGGPAVRIVGELDRGEPCRAWLEYQDWGTLWTRYFEASSATLCEYADNFFFGE
jgi:hypothetical protein